jgi:lipopolysaccharide/colanic/teichoic acid biosynthesis glycosyltransferase
MKDIVNRKGMQTPDIKRLTIFGLFIRSTSIDEIPSLWNVFIGDMSLVGPRPLLVEYLPLYSKEQARRHDVKPGITGWAQINGRNALSWREKFELDVWYVNNHTFFLDLKILLMTIKKVLFREGIAEKGQVTMSKFTGNTK